MTENTGRVAFFLQPRANDKIPRTGAWTLVEEITRNDLKIILMFGLHMAMPGSDFSLPEKQLLGRFFKKLRLSKSEKKEVTRQQISLVEYLGELSSEAATEQLVEFLCAVARVDGKLDEAKISFIEKVISQLKRKKPLLSLEEWGEYDKRAAVLVDSIAVPPRVVVAEDDESIGKLVQYKLQGSGIQVLWLTDGAKALRAIEEEIPDLVVLDIDMPALSGFEVLAAMKSNPETSSTPVIMLTAQKTKTDVSKAIGLGASDYIVKPFRPADLLERVKRHLPKH